MNKIFCASVAVVAMAALGGACGADDKREEKPRFKGVELYSWKDEKGDWVFVMLNGTNREKPEKEVKGTDDPTKGAEALKKALARLAVGEHVFWNHRIGGFEFPPEATRDEIRKAAKDAEIDLQVQGAEDVLTTLGTHRLFDGRDHLMLTLFGEDRPDDVSWHQAGSTGPHGRELPEKVGDRLPKEFLERHSDN